MGGCSLRMVFNRCIEMFELIVAKFRYNPLQTLHAVVAGDGFQLLELAVRLAKISSPGEVYERNEMRKYSLVVMFAYDCLYRLCARHRSLFAHQRGTYTQREPQSFRDV